MTAMLVLAKGRWKGR